MTTAIQSNRVLLDGELRPAKVTWCDGVISQIESPSSSGSDVLDVGDALVFPGLVDAHVHLNEPGRTDWEGFATGTRAAAAGGFTTLVDMPLNCSPVTTSTEALEAKLEAGRPQLSVDVGCYGGIIGQSEATLSGLAKAGVLGAKAFTIHSGLDEFPNVTMSQLADAMKTMKPFGIPVLVHAEVDLGHDCTSTADPRSYHAYLAQRPDEMEVEAIRQVIELVREIGTRAHIVHLSSAKALPMIEQAKSDGMPLTVETCPHYLCLEAERIEDGQTLAKCAPPIRHRENREALWAAVQSGLIDFVTSDHSPCVPSLKGLDHGHFEEAWGGISSLQLGLPLVWTEWQARGGSPKDLGRWFGAAPAAWLGLEKKGHLAVGMDADFCIWDPDASFQVNQETFYVKHPVSPYLGQSLRGKVQRTILRGETVFEADRGHTSQLTGRFILNT